MIFISAGAHPPGWVSSPRNPYPLRTHGGNKRALGVGSKREYVLMKGCHPPVSSPSQAFLPPGSRRVGSRDYTPLVTGGRGLSGPTLEAAVGFHVCPCPDPVTVREGEGGEGEGEVGAGDKLWRLAGGDVDAYGQHASFSYLAFKTVDTASIGNFVRSVLGE
jgi:hypothetical protein